MPELPEVETIRRDLSEKIVGVPIVSVELKDKKLGEAKNFAKFLVGKKISAVERIGKLLIFKNFRRPIFTDSFKDDRSAGF